MKERASMTEPVRLLDGAGDDVEVALLRAATSTPPDTARERAVALFESGGAGAAVLAARGVGEKSVARSHWTWIGWSSLGVTMLVAGLAVVRGSNDAPQPAPSATAVPPSPLEPAPTPHHENEPAPSPVVPVTALPSVAPSPTARLAPRATGSSAPAAVAEVDEPKPNLLAEEVAALDGVRRALRGGDTAAAQRVLDDYDRRFPAGILAPEATLLRVEALLEAGDEAAARRLGEQFLAKTPNGAYVGRMRTLLQTGKRSP